VAAAKGSNKASTRASSRRSGSGTRLLALFGVAVAVIYLLVFFTGSKSASPKLGIDLQGGTRVTLTARTPDGKAPSQDSLNKAKDIIESRVNGLGVAGSEVAVDGQNLIITVPGKDSSQARSLGQTARMFIRPVVGGPLPSATTTTPAPKPAADETQTQTQTKAIAAARATRQSTDQKVQVQAATSLNCGKPDPLEGNDLPSLPLIACNTDNQIYLLGPSIVDGQDMTDASSGYDSTQAAYTVSLGFKSNASKAWAEFTSANVGKQAAFVLDSKIISAPTIESATPEGSKTQITGHFSQTSADQLANQLKYGSLPLSFAQSEAQTVSATLGLSSLHAGLLAGGIGLILVLLYCLLYYRALGFLIAFSLVASGVAIFGLLVLLGRWINFTLDLPGIAGLIIGIGMTADSFVVFFERIKDEMREGRSFRSAVPRGWTRAQRTNLSGKTVSLIASAVLYELAAGPVRGFAFTLGLTTVMDVIVLFLVTAPLLKLASHSVFWAKPSVNGLGAIQEIARERRAATGVPVNAGRRA